MVGKEIDPSDIGKHPKLIKAAQEEMAQLDVLVCGKCHDVYHFIEDFKDHKEIGCEKSTIIKDYRDTQAKVWAFLLWKTTQLHSKDNNSNNRNSWKLYQSWVKLEESARNTWLVAGRTILTFSKVGEGDLQETPVKITKTVTDSSSKILPTSTPSNRSVVPKIVDNKIINKKEEPDEVSPNKVEQPRLIKKQLGPAPQILPKIATSTPIQKPVATSRRAKRTLPNTSGQELEEENVEKIVAKRYNPRRKMHEYLVKWDGFPHDQNTWEPHNHLENVPHLLDMFEKQLARQKEQRAAQQAKQHAETIAAAVKVQSIPKPLEQRKTDESKLTPTMPASVTSSPSSMDSTRPLRTSKTKAFDQVKQWCDDDDDCSTSPVPPAKRKLDDMDFDDTLMTGDLEEDLIPSHTVKRMKNGNTISVKVETRNEAAKVTQVQPKVIKAVNGSLKSSATEPSAEVVFTKDAGASGVVKKSGVISPSPATGETATSGIIRVNSENSGVSSTRDAALAGQVIRRVLTPAPKPSVATSAAGTRITQIANNKTITGGRITPTTSGGQVSQVQTARIVNQKYNNNLSTEKNTLQPKFTTKIVSAASSVSSGARVFQTQPKTATIAQRTSLSPSIQQTSPTSGKMIIQRNIKSAPNSKNVTPEQRIIQLSKSGDLKVTKKVITQSLHSQQPQQQQQSKSLQLPRPRGATSTDQVQIQKIQQIAPPTTVTQRTTFSTTTSPTSTLTLCPVTGKILGQAEGEPSISMTEKKDKDHIGHSKPLQSGVLQTQLITSEQQEQIQNQHSTDELAQALAGNQQILTNEDGTPLLVTGEDGTIYQVAGKNAEGQTILIAQGADGEQQYAYVAADDGGEEGGVLTLDNAVAEAVAQMLPEQQAEALAAAAAAQGGDTQFILKQPDGTSSVVTASGDTVNTQALTIQTGEEGSESQDANIPAEVVQADLPSPGGTRRVVLLLQDGTFMMTEMHDDEYQALNIMS